jgi:SAM-dependent methyltransferase
MSARPARDDDSQRFDAFEAAGWERAASAYDRVLGQLTRQSVDPLLDAAEVAGGERVLDLATGPGYVAGRAADRGADAIGLDVTEAMLALASANHPAITFRRGDMHELPFEDGTFDAVVGNFAILHVGRPDQVVAEAARVLTAAGRLALTVWDGPSHSQAFAVVLDALAQAGASSPADLPPGPAFFKYADDNEFRGLLERAPDSSMSTSPRCRSANRWHRQTTGGSPSSTARCGPQRSSAASRRTRRRRYAARSTGTSSHCGRTTGTSC